MTPRRNIQHFTANVNGIDVQFTCWTTSTRCGFCHTASCNTYDTTDTKVSYYNRTWETFTYETALSRAIDKLPYKSLREGARADSLKEKETPDGGRIEPATGSRGANQIITVMNILYLAFFGGIIGAAGEIYLRRASSRQNRKESSEKKGRRGGAALPSGQQYAAQALAHARNRGVAVGAPSACLMEIGAMAVRMGRERVTFADARRATDSIRASLSMVNFYDADLDYYLEEVAGFLK